MVNLLKTFGKGVLYIIGFPFFIIVLLIFGAIGVFLFIFHLFKSIFYFFTGQKFFPELPEDKELRLKQEAMNGSSVASNDSIIDQEPIVNEQPTPLLIREAPIYNEPEPPVQEENDSIEEACFKQDEEPKEEIREDDFVDLKRDESAQSIDIFEPVSKEEELEEYVPKGSSYVEDINDDDDTPSGVDIDYDVR